MAHELDFNEMTGEAAMISRIETAWHRLGIVFDPSKGEMDLDSALRLAGLDWKVKKVNHFIWDEIAGIHKPSDDAFSIVRQDRQEVVGTVGSFYHPLQNEEAFGVLRPLLESGVARIETAGSLRGGKQVWMLVRFDVETILRKAIEAGGDESLLGLLVDENLPYGLFTNDHSGGARARIKETAVRVVCANTYGMSMNADEQGTSVEITHGKNVAESYKAAAQLMLNGVGQRFAALAQARQAMKVTILRDYLGWGERPFQRLVLDQVAPVAHLEAKILRRDDNPHTRTALEKANRVREEVRQLWTDGKGHEGDGSAWEAFQGAVEWIDHGQSSVKGKENRDEKRAESLHGGHLNGLKSRIARKLFAYAAADDEGKEALVFNS